MRILVFVAFQSLFIVSAFSQNFTNKGKDFWIGYGNHVRMVQGSPYEKMQLYITSDVSTSGSVSISSVGFNQAFSITANQITTIDIPRSAALLNEGIYDHGIHVTAQKPVIVYSFIYVNAISGATLCLPTTTLGREYYSINYKQESNEPGAASSYFFAVAADTGITTIEIIPSQTTVGGKPAGVPFTVDLTQGQIIQVLSAVDLTGSIIRTINSGAGCKKIAVFCGSGKISIGCPSPGTSDNLYQQMYPTSTWGKSYITVPSINLPNKTSQYNFFRIFRSSAAATVKWNGAVIPAGNFVNGLYADMPATNMPGFVQSDLPIMVAQYFTTEECGGNTGDGDPEMIFLNPVEQTLSKVTLNSMQPVMGTNITQHFINVVLRNNPAAISTFKIDGTGYAGSFIAHPNAPGYAYARIEVNRGAHTITCDTAFNALAYGFGDAESYGYSAGTNLKDLYQFVSIHNEYAVVNFPASCKGSPFKFAITFPYQPLQLKWVFGTALNDMGIADTIINSPVFDSSWLVDGRTLYRYKVNRSYSIPASGIYSVSLFANNPTADGCSGLQEINYDLEIFDQPSADFNFSTTGCVSDSVSFTDNSTGNGRTLMQWNWDFGDASAASLLNPRHKYNTSGDISVKHSVITDIGCLSDTVSKVVSISDVPVAGFLTSTPLCESAPFTFSDASTIGNGGTIEKWSWNLGDGTIINALNTDPIAHTYPAPNTYNINLQVESSTSCKSALLTQPVTIHYLPSPNFGTPEVCLADPYAQFTDSSGISDGSAAQLSYLWDFGDPNATAANPNSSIIKDAQHKYTAAGTYNVTLTAISKDGCAKSVTKPFMVNGAVPQAQFSIDNSAGLCANKEVLINDASTVDVGNIVKTEIYWDYSNDPTVKTIDEDPTPGKQYMHLYPEFGAPASRTVQIRYVAYSGINCVSERTQTVTLYASPKVKFDPIAAMCEETQPFLLTAAKEIYGFTGTGIYTGPGIVSPDGLFNPSLAGGGPHAIRYDFTSTNGCSAFAEQTVQVFAQPVVDAGPDRQMLEGGMITIAATSTGNNLEILWTPAVAIDDVKKLQPKVSPADDITYKLEVTTADGCSASDEVLVTILKKLVVPNAFSPNGDGINDNWVIQYLESYPGASVQVFNRYGQIVFSSAGYPKPWDGSYKGQPLPVGTYYWIINPKNGRAQQNGSVTIIR